MDGPYRYEMPFVAILKLGCLVLVQLFQVLATVYLHGLRSLSCFSLFASDSKVCLLQQHVFVGARSIVVLYFEVGFCPGWPGAHEDLPAFCLPSAGIEGLHSHAWPLNYFLIELSRSSSEISCCTWCKLVILF